MQLGVCALRLTLRHEGGTTVMTTAFVQERSSASPGPTEGSGSLPGLGERVRWIAVNVFYIIILLWFGAFGGNGRLLVPIFILLLLDFVLSRKWIARAGYET
jgi:hypothetical protein